MTRRYVRVCLVEPGATATELAGHNRPEVFDSIRNQFGQTMQAEDIADAIIYIVTRPRHVAVNEMLIRPTEQVARRWQGASERRLHLPEAPPGNPAPPAGGMCAPGNARLGCQPGRRPAGAHACCWRVDMREGAQRRADVRERGWREHDAAAIAALYAEGAFWQQHSFREPEPGYLARVFAEEESARCRFGTPIVDGDQAAVPWSAQTRLTDGSTEDLAGASLLRFRAGGLVVEERDFWTQG